MEIQYRLFSNADLKFKYLDDECVVYNTFNGETLLIESNSAKILGAISIQSKSLSQLIKIFNGDNPTLESILNQFIQADLVVCDHE